MQTDINGYWDATMGILRIPGYVGARVPPPAIQDEIRYRMLEARLLAE